VNKPRQVQIRYTDEFTINGNFKRRRADPEQGTRVWAVICFFDKPLEALAFRRSVNDGEREHEAKSLADNPTEWFENTEICRNCNSKDIRLFGFQIGNGMPIVQCVDCNNIHCQVDY